MENEMYEISRPSSSSLLWCFKSSPEGNQPGEEKVKLFFFSLKVLLKAQRTCRTAHCIIWRVFFLRLLRTHYTVVMPKSKKLRNLYPEEECINKDPKEVNCSICYPDKQFQSKVSVKADEEDDKNLSFRPKVHLLRQPL